MHLFNLLLHSLKITVQQPVDIAAYSSNKLAPFIPHPLKIALNRMAGASLAKAAEFVKLITLACADGASNHGSLGTPSGG